MMTFLAVAALAAGVAPELAVASASEVLAAVRTPGAPAVVVNLWATWCQPCREEFPDIVRIGRDFRGRGVRVLFVSTDFLEDREQARKYLASQGVTDRSFIKDDGSDMAFIDALEPRWTGIIPATLVFDGGGTVRWFHEGKTDYGTLKSTIDGLLAAPAAPSGHPNANPQRQEKESR
jgi:thiol-disulfide isomerase/thioredoxin